MTKVTTAIRNGFSACMYTFSSFYPEKASLPKKIKAFLRFIDTSFEFKKSLACILDKSQDVKLSIQTKADVQCLDDFAEFLKDSKAKITEIDTPSYVALNKILSIVEEAANPLSPINNNFDIRVIRFSPGDLKPDQLMLHLEMQEGANWSDFELECSKERQMENLRYTSTVALCNYLNNPENRLEVLDISNNLAFILDDENRYDLFKTMATSEFCNVRGLKMDNMPITATIDRQDDTSSVATVEDIAKSGSLLYVHYSEHEADTRMRNALEQACAENRMNAGRSRQIVEGLPCKNKPKLKVKPSKDEAKAPTDNIS